MFAGLALANRSLKNMSTAQNSAKLTCLYLIHYLCFWIDSWNSVQELKCDFPKQLKTERER